MYNELKNNGFLFDANIYEFSIFFLFSFSMFATLDGRRCWYAIRIPTDTDIGWHSLEAQRQECRMGIWDNARERNDYIEELPHL